MTTFTPKSRRLRFHLHLTIADLNNVPLVSGTSFVKWHLPHSTAAEHRGRTSKAPIRDHRVAYDYSRDVGSVRMSVGREGALQECCLECEVVQEYSAGGRGERIRLGGVRVNLAEYVGGGDGEGEGEGEGVVRRYLMQDSKINSTLKLGIRMRFVDGTREFTAPPLRTAPVFGGIAGIISSAEPVHPGPVTGGGGEGGEGGNDVGAPYAPSLGSSARETGEMQDMYRRTLAASWACQPGELRADECIEDIFAGGDGWGARRPGEGTPAAEGGRAGDVSESTTPNANASEEGRQERQTLRPPGSGRLEKARAPRKRQGEIDEFDVRDDLRSWKVWEQGTAIG